MRVTHVQLKNFRAVAKMDPLQLGDVTVLVGPNSSGKSSVIRALHLLQEEAPLTVADFRKGDEQPFIAIGVETPVPYWSMPSQTTIEVEVRLNGDESGWSIDRSFLFANQRMPAQQFRSRKPNNYIVHFLANRKVQLYSEEVGTDFSNAVGGNVVHLAARLAAIGAADEDVRTTFHENCKDILGFPLQAYPIGKGFSAGVDLGGGKKLPISQLGEGVPQMVALLIDLLLEQGKLFLIEEPENDLHPEALRRMLDAIIESSKRNQFVVSTHSNIVVRHLGGESGSRLYSVGGPRNVQPTSATFTAVSDRPEDRMRLLRDLGYSFADYGLWEGWLILEESSAETIIRKYLIPNFAPSLSNIQLISANGTGNVEPAFADFYRLALYAHLEKAMRGAAWVRVDGDASGRAVIEKLRDRFRDWRSDRFGNYSKEMFERYYPDHFSSQVDQIAAAPKNKQRDLKKALLLEVIAWLDSDPKRGKSALAVSAKEVIKDLQKIANELRSLE